ncbi:MAG: DnaD domain-containing protein [Bacillota bacterium]
MANQNMTAWFMESGFVGIPKNLLGLMEPLGLTFDDLGKIVYLLYCGCDQINKNDSYAMEAIRSLHKKNLVFWHPDIGKVDFSPMFDLIANNLGAHPAIIETAVTQDEMNYSQFIKSLEKKLARFLSVKEKVELQKVVQQYNWSYDLLLDMYIFFQSSFRRHYAFAFFAQMAFGAKVQDRESLGLFIEKLNYTLYKVIEVKRRLGQKNNPTEVEKECYQKWFNEWKFSHEMILLAVEQTIHATDPSFSYIDKILENWHQAGVKTPDALTPYLEKRKNYKKQNRGTDGGGQSSKKQYVNSYIRDLNDLVE